MTLRFDNTYINLPTTFYSRQDPASFPNVELLALNRPLLRELGGELGEQDLEGGAHLTRLLSGQDLFEGARPLAQVYAGHQFGQFNPQLGDGRALLLGEVLTPRNQRFDIQLKGSGQTAYSRSGDGRSPIGPVLREYIVSEAMHAMGVPTTRSLSAVQTGENIYRETRSPGAVLARVAKSHIRVGTFQYFLGQGDYESLRTLADYTINRHYPGCWDAENPYLQFFREVVKNLNHLIVEWMSVGFIHGVMNTDNMAVSGETIDYGPCSFMDQFRPGECLSFIDRGGRYRYENQTKILQWNLARFAECLVTLVSNDQDEAVKVLTAELDKSVEGIEKDLSLKMGRKLGVLSFHKEDEQLVSLWLKHLEHAELDFTNSHRRLIDVFEGKDDSLRELDKGKTFRPFYELWERRVFSLPPDKALQAQEQMKNINPMFVPRNHLIQRAITEAEQGEKLVTFHRLREVLKDPFRVGVENQDLLEGPRPNEVVSTTFCGT